MRQAIASIIRNLNRLAETVAPLGMQVHYHNHAGSYIETPSEVAALVAHIEGSPVNLCFDTGHYAYGGGNANEFVASHLDSIGYLHLKDVNGKILTEGEAARLELSRSLAPYHLLPTWRGRREHSVYRCHTGQLALQWMGDHRTGHLRRRVHAQRSQQS